MSIPLVSILLPFHGDIFPEACLQSILEQDYTNWELVLVSNANTPETHTSLEAFAAKDARIRILLEPFPGIAYALNTGWQAAKGKYVARMDADDIMLPGRLRAQVASLEADPELQLVSGLVEPDGQEKGMLAYVEQVNSWRTPEELARYRFVESPFVHPSVMFRRDLLEKYGPYSTAPIPEDYELWLRWFQEGLKMEKADIPVIRWTDHPKRLSRTHPNYSPDSFDRVRYHYLSALLRPRLAQLPPVIVLGGGKMARRKLQLLEKAQIPVHGISDLVKRHVPGKMFIPFRDLPAPGEYFLISLVSSRGQFVKIEESLREKGYQTGVDLLLAG